MPMGRGHRNCPSLSATMTESNGRCCGNLGSHVAEHGFDLLACHQGEREGHSWGKCTARLDQNAGPCCCNHLSVPSPVPWPITTSMKWCFLLKSTGSWFGVLSPQPFPGLQASLFIPPAALGFCHFFLQACSYAVNLWLLKHLAIGGIRRNALQLLAALGLVRPVLKPVVQDLSKFHIMPQSAPGGDYATALLLVAATVFLCNYNIWWPALRQCIDTFSQPVAVTVEPTSAAVVNLVARRLQNQLNRWPWLWEELWQLGKANLVRSW